jgi:predicted membrane-bound spermidine synthase
MLGLALGSWGAGRGIQGWTRSLGVSAIYLYALVELIIGLGAFAVPALFRAGQVWLLPFGALDSPTYLSLSALVLGGSILPWCVAMGATFPLMMAFVKQVDRAETHSFSFLYLANVVGAMAGTLLSALALIELLGFRGTLLAAAAANFSIAGVAAYLGARHPLRGAPPLREPARSEPAAAVSAGPLPPSQASLLLAILFATGFCSMGSEVIWVRGFAPILKNLVYSFALLLSTYLCATWLGSWLYRSQLSRQRVLPTSVLVAFLAVACWLPIVVNDPRLNTARIPVLLSVFPFCAGLGYLTPKLIDQYSQGSPRGGGKAYAVNVLGSIVGPLFASYVLLPTVGARYGMALLGLPFLALLGVYWRARALTPRLRISAAVAAGALTSCSFFVSGSYDEGWPGLRGEIRRDHTATVIAWGSGMWKQLTVNGVGQTAMTPVTKLMAHMPLAFFEEPPESALVICFGMGTTFRSLLSWGVDTTAVELVKSVPQSFAYFHPDAEAFLRDPRGRVVIDDGRRFLQRVDRRYDLITVDPSPPLEAAGSGLLYSKEFYDVVKRRLKPAGILAHWFPGREGLILSSVVRSLTRSFPHVLVFQAFVGQGYHFIASMQPVPIPSPEEFVSRMPGAAKKDLTEWNPGALGDAQTFVRTVLASEVDPDSLLHEDPRVVITDDRPFNEYYLLRRRLPVLWER